MPITAAAWLIGGSTALSAYGNYRAGKEMSAASDRAAQLQAQAARESLAFQKEQYQNIKPYLMGGLEGYQNLLQNPDAYKQSPGYLFRLQEGLKAIGIPQGSQHLSGAQLKAMTRYAQDYATSDYDNALRRIAGMSELAQGVGGVGANYANQASNILMNAAQNQARATQNAASARASMYQGIGSSIGQGIGMYYGLKYPNGFPSSNSSSGTWV